MNETPENPALPRPEERNWALAAHLGPIVVGVLSVGMLGWLVPLVIWLTQRETSSFVSAHAKESLNFRITLFIAYIVAGVLVVLIIGIGLLLAIWVLEIVFATIAAIRASEGKLYRYPFAIPLLR